MIKTFKEYLIENAAKKSMYMRRNLVNSDEFIAWAKEAGFGETVTNKELHVTIAFSKKPISWDKVDLKEDELSSTGGKRIVSPLGDEGAVVLKFEDEELQKRWKEIREAGASWDYESYQPHVTITYKKPDELDISKIKPFEGKLIFSKELRNEIDLDWGKKVKHDKT